MGSEIQKSQDTSGGGSNCLLHSIIPHLIKWGNMSEDNQFLEKFNEYYQQNINREEFNKLFQDADRSEQEKFLGPVVRQYLHKLMTDDLNSQETKEWFNGAGDLHKTSAAQIAHSAIQWNNAPKCFWGFIDAAATNNLGRIKKFSQYLDQVVKNGGYLDGYDTELLKKQWQFDWAYIPLDNEATKQQALHDTWDYIYEAFNLVHHYSKYRDINQHPDLNSLAEEIKDEDFKGLKSEGYEPIDPETLKGKVNRIKEKLNRKNVALAAVVGDSQKYFERIDQAVKDYKEVHQLEDNIENQIYFKNKIWESRINKTKIQHERDYPGKDCLIISQFEGLNRSQGQRRDHYNYVPLDNGEKTLNYQSHFKFGNDIGYNDHEVKKQALQTALEQIRQPSKKQPVSYGGVQSKAIEQRGGQSKSSEQQHVANQQDNSSRQQYRTAPRNNPRLNDIKKDYEEFKNKFDKILHKNEESSTKQIENGQLSSTSNNGQVDEHRINEAMEPSNTSKELIQYYDKLKDYSQSYLPKPTKADQQKIATYSDQSILSGFFEFNRVDKDNNKIIRLEGEAREQDTSKQNEDEYKDYLYAIALQEEYFFEYLEDQEEKRSLKPNKK